MNQPARVEPKRIAAVVTEYRRNSHADVIVGKILEGYGHDRQAFPNLRLVSMYVDQFPANDMSRALAKQHNFTIYDSIAGAVTLGRNEVAVDGVLIIGEHGRYERNERGQTLYPRRRFLEGVTDAFAKHRRAVPVFSDKHLSYNWADALDVRPVAGVDVSVYGGFIAAGDLASAVVAVAAKLRID